MSTDSERELTLKDLADLFIDALQTDAEARRMTYGLETPPRVGDVWSTRGARRQDLPTIVVLTYVEDQDLRAALVMQEPDLGASDDVFVPAEQSPVGTPLVLCSWRDVPVVIDDLDRFIGTLPDSVIEPLMMLLENRVSGGFARTPLGIERLSTAETVLRCLVQPEDGHAAGCEYFTGAPILDASDPRLRVRQEVIHHTRYLERDLMHQLAMEDASAVADLVPNAPEARLASRFPLLAESGKLAQISQWRKAAALAPRVFPRAA